MTKWQTILLPTDAKMLLQLRASNSSTGVSQFEALRKEAPHCNSKILSTRHFVKYSRICFYFSPVAIPLGITATSTIGKIPQSNILAVPNPK